MNWVDEAIKKIQTEKIPHRNWRTALSESFSTLLSCSPGEVMCITGPSRVGKTKLLDELGKLLVGDEKSDDDGTMPIVSVLATNCVKNNFFDTKDFTIRALEAIKHPFYGVNAADDQWGFERYKLLHRTSEGDLRRSFETGIELRKTLYFVIDEVQHVLRFYGGIDAASAFLNSLKAFAQEKNIILVFVGAYPILDALRLSPHLLGREQLIHFPRYGLTKEDITIFNQILDFYNEFIRLEPGVKSLREWSEYLYYGSLGCLGLLEKWLRSALAKVRANGDDYLKISHLEHTRKPDDDISSILAELQDGEESIAKKDLFTAATETEKEKIIEPEKSTKKKQKKKKSKNKPFRTKPRRYPVKEEDDS